MFITEGKLDISQDTYVYFGLWIFNFIFLIIVVLGVCCDISKSSYNIS
jgi:hypothetical protein